VTAVGKASEIRPGAVTSVDVAGERIAIANVEGKYHAFSDVYTHRGCSLAEGDLTDTVITCPCHGGQYDVTSGEVLAGPPPEPLRVYTVTVDGEDLTIG
jgi:nitrite reductase/ring-hydroxylating ferredoxin subunit